LEIVISLVEYELYMEISLEQIPRVDLIGTDNQGFARAGGVIPVSIGIEPCRGA
jgi:hypothetical protein